MAREYQPRILRFVSGIDRRLLWMSPGITDVLGWETTELLGTPLARLCHPVDDECITSLREWLYAGEDPLRGTEGLVLRLRTKSGDWVRLQGTATPVRALDGGLLGVASEFRVVAAETSPAGVGSAPEVDDARAPLDPELDPTIVLTPVRDDAGSIVDFEYVDANLAACAYLRVPLVRLIGTQLLVRFPELAALGVFALCVQAAEERRVVTFAKHDVTTGSLAGTYDLLCAPTGEGVTMSWRDMDHKHRQTATTQFLRSRTAGTSRTANAPVEVIAFGDTDGRLQWVSDTVTDLTGWRPAQLVGLSIIDLVHPFDQPTVIETQRALLGAGSGRFDARFATSSGDFRWLNFEVRPLVDEHGAVIGGVAGWSDAHRAALAEERLAESLARTDAAMQASAVGMCLVDAAGRFLEANPALCRILRRSEESLLEADWASLTLPDDLFIDAADVARLVAGDIEHYQVKKRLCTPDGGAIWADLAVGSVRNDDGTLRYFVTQVNDITSAVETQRAFEESERSMRVLLDSSPDAIVQYDRDLRIVYANSGAAELCPLDRDSWAGLRTIDLGLGSDTARRWDDHLARVVSSGHASRFEDVLGTGAGSRWFDVWLTPVCNDDGTVERVVLAARDVTGAKAIESRLLTAATHDALTGLANRAALLDDLHRSLAAAERTDASIAVLVIDLDHFKNINDSLGHLSGDELLGEAAARISAAARESDLVARLGGDEFVIAMREAVDIDGARAVGQRVVEAFRASFTVGDAEVYTTASVGIAVSTPSCSPEDLLREADTALYLAKANGRNRFAVYNEELRTTATERVQLETALRSALERDEFAVWYQPEVDLRSGATLGAEALLRWRSADGSWASAQSFIHVAEETGMIIEIGAWAFEQACRCSVEWNASSLEPRVVRINVSAVQLVDAGFLEMVDDVLARTGADPRNVSVEITETVLLTATPVVHLNIEGLHSRGIALAIDDFGTGYASLTYLRRYPVSAVKLDRSFVAGLDGDGRDAALVGAILALAAHLDLDVVAEGVECEEQARTLIELGCHRAQGFLYAPARPAVEALSLTDAE